MTTPKPGSQNSTFKQTQAPNMGSNPEGTSPVAVMNDNMAESQHSRDTFGSLQDKHDQRLQDQKRERL